MMTLFPHAPRTSLALLVACALPLAVAACGSATSTTDGDRPGETTPPPSGGGSIDASAPPAPGREDAGDAEDAAAPPSPDAGADASEEASAPPPGDAGGDAAPPSDVDFTSIVSLKGCSGSLVRFTTSKPSDPALVLTNGHCSESGFIAAGDAIVDRASTRTFTLLKADGSTATTLTASKVLYGTMTGTDVLLYAVTQTFAQVEAISGAPALTIEDHHGAKGDAIRVISGLFKKIYACKVDGFVHELDEGSWKWQDSIRYTQPGCEVVHGTSGSPIVDPVTKRVVGINNTGNDKGEQCTVNNPCEVDENGKITVTQGAAYGQQLLGIYACLTATNAIDLTLPGCNLTKPLKP